jgi:heme exporter protein D
MYFDSLDALLYMEGHGVFVWSAYLITGVVVGMLLLAPRRRRRRVLRQLSGELRRRQGRPVAVEEKV